MTMNTRQLALGAIFPVIFAIGCGGGGSTTVDKINDAAPEEIPGGGIGSGAVDGKINVYAIDAITEAPIAGASVRVGEADAAKPLEGTTDATGLVTFKDASLQGGQTITITAADHVATTWLGVNGANVTIPMGPVKPPTVETANIEGSFTGWDALPATMNHVWLGLVLYSWNGDLGDGSNDIQQPMGMGLPPNSCLKLPPPAPSQPCNWKLVTRTGKQILFGIVVDVDTKGTFADQTDDTQTFYGYAFKTGVDVQAGDKLTGQMLDMLPPAGLIDLKLPAPAAPAGMDESIAIPLLDMGDEGQIPFYLGDLFTLTKIPAISGIFAGGHYDVIARADAKGKPFPSTTLWARSTDMTKDVVLPAYQATPTDIAANGGVYSFKPVSGATIHSVKFQVPMGDRVWNVGIYDERTEFSLPTLTPDPLPVGKINLSVEALLVPGVDVQNFDTKTAKDKVTAVSENGVEITH